MSYSKIFFIVILTNLFVNINDYISMLLWKRLIRHNKDLFFDMYKDYIIPELGCVSNAK